MAKITCFDGVRTIGGNKILLSSGGAQLFFDFGKNFSAEGVYYDDFMQPKSVFGFYEHAQLGLLPPLNDIYREDMVSSTFDPWVGIETKSAGDIAGVLVSHAHVDHIGHIHFLRTDIPIFCSTMTAAISKAMQDTTAGGMEYVYTVKREEKEDVLASPHYKTEPSRTRPHSFSDTPASPAEFSEFWQRSPGGEKGRQLEAGEVREAGSCGGMDLMSWPVDHSIYGATAWAVKTDAGWVVYAGDLRTHGSSAQLTYDFAKQAARLSPVAMIMEGTRITEKGGHTERDVMEASEKAVSETSGLVVADFGPRNIERLKSFYEVARNTGRQLAILPKDAYLIEAMTSAGGTQEVPILGSPGLVIYKKYSGATYKWQKYLEERYDSIMVSPQDVAKNQDGFICAFSYWDINEIAYIKPCKDSAYIYSSCDPFNEEMELGAEKLKKWIDEYDMKLYGKLLSVKQIQEGKDSRYDPQSMEELREDPFHVSGHASGPDLKEIVQTIAPKKVIPVHSMHPELYNDMLDGFGCEIEDTPRNAEIVIE